MINFRFLSKNFSKNLKVNFINNNLNTKNLIYFCNESDLTTQPNELSKILGQPHNELRLKDLKSKNTTMFYKWSDDVNECPFSERMLVVKCDKNPDKLRNLAGNSLKALSAFKLNEIDVKFSKELPIQQRLIILNSLIMSNYSFEIKSKAKEVKGNNKEEGEQDNDNNNSELKELEQLNVLNDEIIHLNQNDVNFWINLAKANLYTRDLANSRGENGNCGAFEREAKSISDEADNITVEVIKGKELENKGLNLLYNVGKAAQSEPRLVIMKYQGNDKEEAVSHAFVGKGVTFDTGGLNLKPTNYIEDMYLDKHGAANALAIMRYVAKMKLPVNIVCALALAENSIDSRSYKPSDIITSYKGLTVEITNTDAEGRLCLADALSYIQQQYKPTYLVDFATLTGACMGNRTAGLFTNDENLSSDLVSASLETQEPIWHLPINEEHREDLKSKHADLKNSGSDRFGGASKGAAFLEKFIEKETKWVHLDIAGPSTLKGGNPVKSPGATGFGTQLILKYLFNFINSQSKNSANTSTTNESSTEIDQNASDLNKNKESSSSSSSSSEDEPSEQETQKH